MIKDKYIVFKIILKMYTICIYSYTFLKVIEYLGKRYDKFFKKSHKS